MADRASQPLSGATSSTGRNTGTTRKHPCIQNATTRRDKLPTRPGRSMTIGRLPRSRHNCDNPTGILTVGEKVQYAENTESATHIRVTYRCTDEGDGTDLSEPSAAGQHLELYRRASDPRDLLRLHGSVGALDKASAQKHHGCLPLITHVPPQETNKCASSQTR